MFFLGNVISCAQFAGIMEAYVAHSKDPKETKILQAVVAKLEEGERSRTFSPSDPLPVWLQVCFAVLSAPPAPLAAGQDLSHVSPSSLAVGCFCPCCAVRTRGRKRSMLG